MALDWQTMHLKILTVDDSQTIRIFIKRAFAPYNCDILEAQNGVEGLAMARCETPDLIFLDITMPLMSGIEMLNTIKRRKQLKNIPIVMLSADSSKDTINHFMKMGAADYIVKPFRKNTIVESAQKIVRLQPKKNKIKSKNHFKKFSFIYKDICVVILPDLVSKELAIQLNDYIQSKLASVIHTDVNNLILYLGKISQINMLLIKLIIMTVMNCQKLGIPLRIVGTPGLGKILRGFKETNHITVDATITLAKLALQNKIGPELVGSKEDDLF
ncbi:response regulator [Desulfococcaceae bacterium HSG9]|nr:response regulator [Desulfococcaceae bacterium HSG9]